MHGVTMKILSIDVRQDTLHRRSGRPGVSKHTEYKRGEVQVTFHKDVGCENKVAVSVN